MVVTPAAIAVGGALAANAILKLAEQEALLSGPEYIRDAEPEGLPRRIGLGLARQACRRYADNPDGVPPERAVQFEGVCRPYLDNIGYGTGPILDQPFKGGQCPVTYTVTVAFTDFFGNPQTTLTQGFLGPVVGLRANPPNEFGNVFVDLVSGAGDAFSVRPMFATSPDNVGSGVITSVVREDGQPDNCGSPAPDITQPQPPSNPGPTFEPIIIVPTINIDAGVTVNLDGTIEIQIGPETIEIDPFGGDGDDGSGEPGGPGGGGAPGGAEGGPVIPGGNGGFGGDDELGPPPAGKRWIGICLAITNRPKGFGPIASNTVDKVYPEVVGNVRLICNAMGTEIVNTPVQIRSDRVCLWEPARGVTVEAIRVNLKPGFGYSYQGYAVPATN